MSDLDYVRGIHSFRTGVDVNGAWVSTDEDSNYLGTYTFESIDAYIAGTPRSYTRRIGDPNISYSNVLGGVYVQDDIRVRKNLTISPGIRYEAADPCQRLQQLRATFRRELGAVQERANHHPRQRRHLLRLALNGTYEQTCASMVSVSRS